MRSKSARISSTLKRAEFSSFSRYYRQLSLITQHHWRISNWSASRFTRSAEISRRHRQVYASQEWEPSHMKLQPSNKVWSSIWTLSLNRDRIRGQQVNRGLRTWTKAILRRWGWRSRASLCDRLKVATVNNRTSTRTGKRSWTRPSTNLTISCCCVRSDRILHLNQSACLSLQTTPSNKNR